LSSETTRPEPCQVDFYLLGASSSGADKLACRLALMAWERKQKIFIITASESSGKQLGELMWQYPDGRFLPHTGANEEDSGKAPVNIGTLSGLNPTDVVINLCPEAVPRGCATTGKIQPGIGNCSLRRKRKAGLQGEI
jgi:DNA polymerase IIIc chi subunit